MKNLANCKPSEFLKQTVLIKRAAEEWLDSTKIFDIMKTIPPNLKTIEDYMSEEEKNKIIFDNKIIRHQQIRKNISKAFDVIMEENPEKTLVLLALVCFIDPKDVDKHPMEEYMLALSEMIGSEAVIGFFSSLARWAQTDI